MNSLLLPVFLVISLGAFNCTFAKEGHGQKSHKGINAAERKISSIKTDLKNMEGVQEAEEPLDVGVDTDSEEYRTALRGCITDCSAKSESKVCRSKCGDNENCHLQCKVVCIKSCSQELKSK